MSKVPPLPPGVEGRRLGSTRPERRAAEDRYWDRRGDDAPEVATPLPPGVEGHAPGHR